MSKKSQTPTAKTTGVPPLNGLSGLKLKRWREYCLEMLFKKIRGLIAAQTNTVDRPSVELVLDERLMGVLSQTVDVHTLHRHSVSRILRLGDQPLAFDGALVMYIVRGDGESARYVATQLRAAVPEARADMARPMRSGHLVLCVPQRTSRVERVLELEGVFGRCGLDDLPWGLMAMDDGLLSMEAEMSFRALFLDRDIATLHPMARALADFQRVYGRAKAVCSVGHHADVLRELLDRMTPEDVPDTSALVRIVILDRSADLVTPLCTQLTYEGLLDEVLGVQSGKVVTPDDGTRRAVNGGDLLFGDIRRLNFAAIRGVLHRRARETADAHSEGTQLRNRPESVEDPLGLGALRGFTSKLPRLVQDKEELQVHTNLALHLQAHTQKTAFLERLRAEQDFLRGRDESEQHVTRALVQVEPVATVARLMCLLSLTHGGVPPKRYDSFRQEFLHAFGFQHLVSLYNFEQVGLFLRSQAGRNRFADLRRMLSLIVDAVDDAASSAADPAYVFSGYAPLSVRLADGLACDRFRPREIDDLSRHLAPAGPVHAPRAADKPDSPSHRAHSAAFSDKLNAVKRAPSADDTPLADEPTVLVVFLGGVTRAELAAFSWLSEMREVRYCIATTHIITGSSLIRELLEV